MRSNLLDGPMMRRYGLGAAPASHSLPVDTSTYLGINAIFGRNGTLSSRNAGLQLSLVNKLRGLMASSGSPECISTWKRQITRSGLLLSVHQVSGLGTIGSDSTFWPTPMARDYKDLSRTGSHKASHERHQPSVVCRAYDRGYQTSQVPYLVATLMGYPDQWISLSPSETP